MEEKISFSGRSFRSFFSHRYSLKPIFSGRDFIKTSSLYHLTKTKGFTLVEVLIALSILGIIVVGFLALLNPTHQLAKSRDAKRKSDIKQIQSALELYRADKGVYPPSVSSTFANCPIPPTMLVDNCTTPVVKYLQTVPKDPKTKNNYNYCTTACGLTNGYRIYYCLENKMDTEARPEATPDWLVCPPGSGFNYVENP